MTGSICTGQTRLVWNVLSAIHPEFLRRLTVAVGHSYKLG